MIQSIKQPLAQSNTVVSTATDIEADDPPFSEMSFAMIVKQCLFIMKASFTVAFSILLQLLFVTINLHYIGRLNDQVQLDAIGLANITLNCVGVVLIIGMNMGAGSLVGRAHGAQSDDLKRNYFNKGLLCLVVLFSAVCAILVHTERIFVALGQHEDVARVCAYYVMSIMPGVFAQLIFDLMRNVLCAQGIFAPSLCMMLAALSLHILLCGQLIAGHGLYGIICAMNVSSVAMLAAKVVYLSRSRAMQAQRNVFQYQDFFGKTLRGLQAYAAQTLHVALPLFVDFFCFEVNSLLVGYSKDLAQFGAHVAMTNYCTSCFSLPSGVSGTITYLTSNACGARKVQRAKNYNRFGIIIAVAFGSVVMVFNWLAAHRIAAFYTHDAQIEQYFVAVLRFWSYVLILDYIQMVQSGVMKGMGLGMRNLKLFVIGFYCVGIPSSVYFAFALHLGLLGLWGGFMLGVITVAVLIWSDVRKLNWPLQVQKVHFMLLEDHKHIGTEPQEVAATSVKEMQTFGARQEYACTPHGEQSL